MVESTPKDEIVRILHNDDKIEEILDRIALYYVDKYQDELEMTGLYLNEEQLEIAIQSTKEQLKNRPEIFIKNMSELITSQVDCTVYISNEELDMGSTVDKLTLAANLLPEQDRPAVIRTIFDTLGLPYPQELTYKKRQQITQPMPMMQENVLNQ